MTNNRGKDQHPVKVSIVEVSKLPRGVLEARRDARRGAYPAYLSLIRAHDAKVTRSRQEGEVSFEGRKLVSGFGAQVRRRSPWAVQRAIIHSRSRGSPWKWSHPLPPPVPFPPTRHGECGGAGAARLKRVCILDEEQIRLARKQPIHLSGPGFLGPGAKPPVRPV